MASIGLGPASLLSLFLESIVYGIFLLLYCIILGIAYGEKTVPLAQRRMFQVSSLMLLLATAHLVLAFIRVLRAFTPVNGVIDPSVLGQLQAPLYRAKVAIYFLQTMLGDAVMIWRCFVIYNKRWWILIPGVLAQLIDIAILIIRLLPPKVGPTSQALPLIPLGWRIAFLGVTLALHLIGSTAIVVRIYLTRRPIRYASRSLSPVIIAMVESAAIYTVCVFLLLIFNVVQSNGQFVVMDIIVPLVGVVFCLIVIRVRLYLNTPDPTKRSTASRGGNNNNFWTRWRRQFGYSNTISEIRGQLPRTVDEIQIQYTQERTLARDIDISFPSQRASVESNGSPSHVPVTSKPEPSFGSPKVWLSWAAPRR